MVQSAAVVVDDRAKCNYSQYIDISVYVNVINHRC